MASEWFCKINGKSIGPLSGQQLKVMAGKGQLRPEHLVRRGDEGPWAQAEKIKGLFSAATASDVASPSPRNKGRPVTVAKAPPDDPPPKATPIPKAKSGADGKKNTAASRADQAANSDDAASEEFEVGAQHASLNVDNLDIDDQPLKITPRKGRSAISLKKSEQKRASVIILSVVGAAFLFAVVAVVWTLINNSRHAAEKAQEEAKILQMAADREAAAAAKREEEQKLEAERKADALWAKIPTEWISHGKIQIRVDKPVCQAPPEGSKVDAEKNANVVVVPVDLRLNKDQKEPVPLASFADETIAQNLTLKDDKGAKYPLLGLIAKRADSKSDVAAITDVRLRVELVFAAPDPAIKYLRLELPSIAFGENGILEFEAMKEQVVGIAGAKSKNSKKPSDKSDGDKMSDAKPGASDRAAKNAIGEDAPSPKSTSKAPARAAAGAKADTKKNAAKNGDKAASAKEGSGDQNTPTTQAEPEQKSNQKPGADNDDDKVMDKYPGS